MPSLNARRNRLMIIAMSTIAITLVGISLWQQSTKGSTKTPNMIEIDFSAYLDANPIEVTRGTNVVVPVMIESDRDADYLIILSVRPERATIDGFANGTHKGPDVEIDNRVVRLSPGDSATAFGMDRVERNSGSALLISAAPNLAPGNYAYLLEAESELADGQGVGSGKFFTIIVK
jgi:hypothetical protein